MDPQIYTLHRENEKEHWWYKGRRKILSSLINDLVILRWSKEIIAIGTIVNICLLRFL